jgi:hypothetical protein
MKSIWSVINFPKQVVIVNSNILPKFSTHWINGESSLETLVALLYGRYGPQLGRLAEHAANGSLKKQDKAPLKFISLKKYMRDYDWEGEFTAEEAATWHTAELEADEEQ